jgi:hypothetical protein
MEEKPNEITLEEFKEHIRNVVTCLINLAPTRNRFTQMLFLLPKQLGDMTETYPNLFSKEGLPLLLQLGISIGEKVDVESAYNVSGTSKIFSNTIKDIVSKSFELFGNEAVRKVLQEQLGIEIPNLSEEWFKHKLEIVFSEPNLGNDAKKLLKTMSEKSKSEYWWEMSVEELEKEAGLPKERIYILRDFLAEFGIVEKASPDGIRLSATQFKDIIKSMLA